MSLSITLEPGERIVYKARVRWVAYIYPLILLLSMLAFRQLTRLSTTELILTDKRLLGKVGMQRIALPYADIGVVRSRQGLLGKLFDYGRVVIVGNDGKRTVFRGIVEPLDVRLQIEEAIEMAVLGRNLSRVELKNW